MFCPHCGQSIEDGVDYCTHCGKLTAARPDPMAQLRQQAQSVPPPAPAKKSPWPWIIGVIVLFIIIGAMNNKDETPEDSSAANGPTTTASAPSVTPPAAKPAPAPAPKKWVTVATLSGRSNKRSAPFTLGSGQKKLKYTIKGNEMPMCAIYLMPEGESLQESGGIPEVIIDTAGSDSTYLAQSPGRYYLDVSAANCNWTVTIIEEK